MKRRHSLMILPAAALLLTHLTILGGVAAKGQTEPAQPRRVGRGTPTPTPAPTPRRPVPRPTPPGPQLTGRPAPPAPPPSGPDGLKGSAPVAEAERNASAQTLWGWYYHQTAEQINELGKANNLRPFNLVPNGLAEHTPRFHVLFVKNAGAYEVAEWQVVANRDRKDAAALSSEAFRSTGWRVTNIAWHQSKNAQMSDQVEWRAATIQVKDALYADYDVRDYLTQQELLALASPQQGLRVVEFDQFEDGKGKHRFAAVVVPNKGKHYRNWAWLFGISRGEILEKAKDIGGKKFRVTDFERHDDGKYDALLTESGGLVTKWYANLTDETIKNDVLRRHGSWDGGKLAGGARLTDLVAYKNADNETRFDVLTMENGLGDYPVSRENVQGFGAFDQAFVRGMSRHGIPASSVAVAKDGKVVYRAAYGWADLKAGKPATVNSRGRIASISKTITAAAIMRLYVDKKLDIDATVFGDGGYLKSLKPFDYDGYKGFEVAELEEITIRQLLNHTAGWDRGLSGDPTVPTDDNAFTCDGSRECEPTIYKVQAIAQHAKAEGTLEKTATRGANVDEIIRWMMKPDDRDYLPARKPGVRPVYSNFGFTVLQKVVEVRSGMPYEDYVKQMAAQMGVQFLPGNSDPDSPVANEWAYHSSPGANGITGVYWSSGKLGSPVPATYIYDMGAMLGHGGWVASPTDLVKFVTKQDSSAGDPYIPNYSFRSMMDRPDVVPKDAKGWRGFAWSVDPMGKENDDVFAFGHGGKLEGSGELYLKGWYDRKVSMAILFNSTADEGGDEIKNSAEKLLQAKDDEGVLAALAK